MGPDMIRHEIAPGSWRAQTGHAPLASQQEHKENVNIDERNSDAHPDQLMIDVTTESVCQDLEFHRTTFRCSSASRSVFASIGHQIFELTEFECIYPVFNSDFHALASRVRLFKAAGRITVVRIGGSNETHQLMAITQAGVWEVEAHRILYDVPNSVEAMTICKFKPTPSMKSKFLVSFCKRI
ncbi:unnamed protein product [Caenorhabditis auriculariae]|uniref:Uncharacterized protein n=1 Tax=Caenorhabditis auriculariae TaxID=2777116 RepID=A0A8S1HBP8_9PELO|nr:unnamed protein product [Caenorhabditis auriculariae]